MIYSLSEEKALKYIDDNKDILFRTLSELVKIDTQNFVKTGNENAGQAYLEKICADEGFAVDRYTPDSVPGLTDCEDYNPGRGTDKRENLVAILDGETYARIMLASHMDTVTIGDAKEWDDDPLSGKIADGKVYGRGTGDDKFGIAVSWYVMKALKDLGIKPKKNVLLGSYADEESGGGNGALGLCMKYPCDCYINLDSGKIDTVALGGGCFRYEIRSIAGEVGIASIFNVFEAMNLVVHELEELKKLPNTVMRLSWFKGGENGDKNGSLGFAIYTDKSKKDTQTMFDNIHDKLKSEFERLQVTSNGFKLTTRFFLYGETDKDSKEAGVAAAILRDRTGTEPDLSGSCLSDLSLIINYGSRNSFNFGMARGSNNLGGAHQPNEHVLCDNLGQLPKDMAVIILRP